MTKKEFICLPAEIHIKSNADGTMMTKLSGDGMKLGYLATRAVEGVF